MMKESGGHYEAPPRADCSEDQLVSGELIQLGGNAARLAIRPRCFRCITHHLGVGLNIRVDQPVIGAEGRARLFDGEWLTRELEVLEHRNDLSLAETASRGRVGGGIDWVIRGLRGLGSRRDRILSIVVGIHSE